MSVGGSTKVILLSLGANVGIAAAKGLGAAVSGSASLLAEAIHSLADCTNQVLLLVGQKAAGRAPDRRHPLGYGKAVFFWSFLVAIILFSMGGLFAVYEGLHKFAHPEPVEQPIIGFSILAVAIVLEGFSFWSCLKEVRTVNTYGTLWAWFRNTTRTDLLVIFTEDLAAMVGLVVALACLTLAWFTGDGRWDAIGSVLVGMMLGVVAFALARELQPLLIGEAPADAFDADVAQVLAEVMPGARVLHLISVQTGAAEVLLAYKFSPPPELKEADRLIAGINEVERRVRALRPEVRWQFVEPDVVK